MTEIVPGCGGKPPAGSASAKGEAAMQEKLDYWRAQAAMTDDQIIAAYIEGFRKQAETQIRGCESYLKQQQDARDYVATFGTDEG